MKASTLCACLAAACPLAALAGTTDTVAPTMAAPV